MAICLSVYLSVCLSVWFHPVCVAENEVLVIYGGRLVLFNCPSVYICLSCCRLSVYLSLCLPVCLSGFPCVAESEIFRIYDNDACVSVCLVPDLTVHLPVCLAPPVAENEVLGNL